MTESSYPRTPDGRYFVVKGRLWRLVNPALSEDAHERLVKQLMDARRELRGKPTRDVETLARARVNDAKVALGERGEVWWTDGTPDFNRKLVKNTPYAAWYVGLNTSQA